MECYTYLRNIQDLLSDWKTPYERRFGATISKDRSFRLVHWLSITLFLRRTSQESIKLERKSYLDCSLDTLSTRGEFGRVTSWLQTLRSWKRWTHRKSTQKRLNAKEVIFPKQGEFIFPIADGRIKTPGGDQELGTSTLIRDHPIRGEGQSDFPGESEGSPPPLPQDSLPDAGEARNHSWPISGNFIYRHHVEPRVKLYSPREESFPIPLKYIDVSRTTQNKIGCQAREAASMTIGISMDQEICLVLETCFTQILLEEKPPDGSLVRGGD